MAKIGPRRDGKAGAQLDFVDATGVRRQFMYATKGEAQDAFKLLVPTRTRRGRKRANVDGRATFATFATQWLKTLGGQRARTVAGYTWVVNSYLIPALGPQRVGDLTSATIHEVLRQLLTNGRRFTFGPKKGKAGAGPLAPRTVGLVHTVLHTLLETAVDAGLVPANPARGLAGKRKLKLCTTTKQRRQRIAMRILPDDELAAFERAAYEHEPAWLPLMLTLTRAGLRCGEVVALGIPDFAERGGGELRVWQAVNSRTGTVGEPKSGPRIVDLSLSAELVAVLRAQVTELKARRLIPWLFPSNEPGADGRVTHERVARAVKRIAKKAGIAHDVSPHDLRHTYATRLLNMPGVNVLYVSRQLGHASVQETIDTYGLTAAPALAAGLVGALDRGDVAADPKRNGGNVVEIAAGRVTDSRNLRVKAKG
jgi:integrase